MSGQARPDLGQNLQAWKIGNYAETGAELRTAGMGTETKTPTEHYKYIKYVFHQASTKYFYQCAAIKHFVFPVKIFDLITIGINLAGLKEIDCSGHL